jgi:hypothetical protein
MAKAKRKPAKRKRAKGGGRKQKNADGKCVVLAVSCSPSLHARIDAAAHVEGVSRSEFVTRLLTAAIAKDADK